MTSSGQRPPVVLSLNVGSSSVKAAVRDPRLRARVELTGLNGPEGRLTVTEPGGRAGRALIRDGWASAVGEVAAAVADRGLQPAVVAHRIVHGSALLTAPRRADDDLLARLREEAHLDPLHLPRQLAVVDEARRAWPVAGVVLVPDSGFDEALPDDDTTLPLPADARAAGLRRWGFHGLAVQSVLDAHPDLGGAVVAHLGSGCSVTAVQDGAPRHTSMALSPAGGIPSVSRSGDLDPEVVLRLVELSGGSVGAVRTLLNERAGLAGLAGGRKDVADLLRAEDDEAARAVRIFVRRVGMAVAAAVSTLDRWDSLVFTGGIGVHSAEIRDRVCARLLVLRPDGSRSDPGSGSRDACERLATTGLRILAQPVDEEAVMDRLVRAGGW